MSRSVFVAWLSLCCALAHAGPASSKISSFVGDVTSRFPEFRERFAENVRFLGREGADVLAWQNLNDADLSGKQFAIWAVEHRGDLLRDEEARKALGPSAISTLRSMNPSGLDPPLLRRRALDAARDGGLFRKLRQLRSARELSSLFDGYTDVASGIADSVDPHAATERQTDSLLTDLRTRAKEPSSDLLPALSALSEKTARSNALFQIRIINGLTGVLSQMSLERGKPIAGTIAKIGADTIFLEARKTAIEAILEDGVERSQSSSEYAFVAARRAYRLAMKERDPITDAAALKGLRKLQDNGVPKVQSLIGHLLGGRADRTEWRAPPPPPQRPSAPDAKQAYRRADFSRDGYSAAASSSPRTAKKTAAPRSSGSSAQSTASIFENEILAKFDRALSAQPMTFIVTAILVPSILGVALFPSLSGLSALIAFLPLIAAEGISRSHEKAVIAQTILLSIFLLCAPAIPYRGYSAWITLAGFACGSWVAWQSYQDGRPLRGILTNALLLTLFLILLGLRVEISGSL